MSQHLSHQELVERLHYDPGTGTFTWLRRSPGQRANGAAGHISKRLGYVQICIDGRLYYGHRLAWFYVHGEWPSELIDHMNGDRADNRLRNLRLATRHINAQNQRNAKAGSSSPLLGVSLCADTKRWRAQIGVNGKRFKLGRFDTQELAHEAYLAAKRRLHNGYVSAE